MRLVHDVLVTAFLLTAPCVLAVQDAIDIRVQQGTATEKQTREQLQRLLHTYDLSPWFFTKLIVIDEKAIPHSHPVLTLHTRHGRDDELLLSTFLHEELHWFLSQRQKDTEEAIKDLRVLFPSVPSVAPEGANGEDSTYLHLLDCYLEYGADQRVLGELRARQVMEFWATDHYTWVYKTVLASRREIGQVIATHNLIPLSGSR